VTLVAAREGAGDKQPLTAPLAAGLASAVPTIRTGVRCSGQAPPMAVAVDAVVVRKLP
jgi:hypothetical protein